MQQILEPKILSIRMDALLLKCTKLMSDISISDVILQNQTQT